MQDRTQSVPEEIANSVSHGIGLLAAVVGAPFLIVDTAQRGSTINVVAVSIFSATMMLLYLISTLYHALPHGRTKRLFLKLDHSAIYLLIAGTYTPFALGVLNGAWGWTLFGLIWGLAVIGLVLKACDQLSHPILSTALYLIMGWLVLIAAAPLIARVPAVGLLWLVGGGLAYTAGVAFFATDHHLRYGHCIWHLFVLAGTTCHFFAVLWYAA
jgi:hemolysin III